MGYLIECQKFHIWRFNLTFSYIKKALESLQWVSVSECRCLVWKLYSFTTVHSRRRKPSSCKQFEADFSLVPLTPACWNPLIPGNGTLVKTSTCGSCCKGSGLSFHEIFSHLNTLHIWEYGLISKWRLKNERESAQITISLRCQRICREKAELITVRLSVSGRNC